MFGNMGRFASMVLCTPRASNGERRALWTAFYSKRRAQSEQNPQQQSLGLSTVIISYITLTL